MTTEHPITPPPELVRTWMERTEYDEDTWFYESYIAEQAARWGADQQLAEDAKWLDHHAMNEAHLKTIPVGDLLKQAMRPKPLSLKEQALEELGQISIGPELGITYSALETIRRALEQLDD
jgi:hypothetical protein